MNLVNDPCTANALSSLISGLLATKKSEGDGLSLFELIFEGFEQTKDHCSSQLTPLGKGWKRAEFMSQIADCWTKQRPSGIIPRVAYCPWQIGKKLIK
jgi:hypothetical protein